MSTLSVENTCERLANEEQKILEPNTVGEKSIISLTGRLSM